MATAASSPAQPTTWPLLSLERFAISRTSVRVVALAVVTSLAFGYRVVALSTPTPVGEWIAAAGQTFPEEAYDYGVREAVAAIPRATGSSAFVVSDASAVVAYYLKAAGRTDLQVRSLSGQGILYGRQPSWVIVQDNHATFENHDVVEQFRRRSVPWREFGAGDAVTAEVFRISER